VSNLIGQATSPQAPLSLHLDSQSDLVSNLINQTSSYQVQRGMLYSDS
jgi:hypothetical protein